jgi:hypothetical protein
MPRWVKVFIAVGLALIVLRPTDADRTKQTASSEAGTAQPSNRFSKTAAAPWARFLRPK